MMNLNPLFFDKSFLVEKKNFSNSSNNSSQSYLFSDIIRIYEDELDKNSIKDSTSSNILLDVNELKNLTITKSNKETVQGIQQAIELLENIALLSNSNSLNINSAHITSKIFILDSESLKKFFNEINESLTKKDSSPILDSTNSKIIYIENRDKENPSSLSEFNFVGFNPDEIIDTIDKGDLFKITLKTNGEKLSLTIYNPDNQTSQIEKDNTDLTNASLSDEQDNDKNWQQINSSNFTLSDGNIVNINVKQIENQNYEIISGEDLTQQNGLNELDNSINNFEPVEKYYKLEVIHTYTGNNNFSIPSKPAEENNKFISNAVNNFFNNNSLNQLNNEKNNEAVDSKIVGVINPINSQQPKENKNTSLLPDEIKNEFNPVAIEQPRANEILKKDFLELNRTELADAEIPVEKFGKSRIIKDTTNKNIIEFKPEIIETEKSSEKKNDVKVDLSSESKIDSIQEKTSDKKNDIKADTSAELKEAKTQLEKELRKLNVDDVRIESKHEKEFVLQVKKSFQIKNELSNEYEPQDSNSENLKNARQEKIIENIAKPNLKVNSGDEKKNQPIENNNFKPDLSNLKTEIKDNSAVKNESNNSKNLTTNQTIKENIKINLASSLSDGAMNNSNSFEKSSKKESIDKKENIKQESANDILNTKNEKAISSEQSNNVKDFVKHTQLSSENMFDQKTSAADAQNELMKNNVHKQLSNLNDTLKIIKANEVITEISKLLENSNYVRQADKQSITFQLSPENLGKLTLSIDYVENQLRANIEVENEQIKQFIQGNIEQLKNSLQASGIQLNDVNVSLGNYEQKSLRQANQKKKAYSKSAYGQVKIENTKTSSSKKLMGYNTYDFLI